MTKRDVYVLIAIGQADDGLTADEFVTAGGRYVNSWAPCFTRLHQGGYTRIVGQRPTSHGSLANVHVLSNRGLVRYQLERRAAA